MTDHGLPEGPQGIEVPEADPTAPDLRQGDRTNPEDTSLPPEPQGEFA